MSNILANNINPRSGNKITIGDVNTTVAIAGTATYEDVTSIDSVGIITARSGINVTGGQLNVGNNIKLGNAGVVTATAFHGDGSSLTGISVDSTKIETGNTKVETIDTGSDGHIKLTTEGTERLRIDSSGRLLLGTTTEGNAYADNFTVEDSGNCGITIRSGSSNYGAIYFSDATSGAQNVGQIEYNHNNNALILYTNSGGRLTLTNDGKVRVPDDGKFTAGASDDLRFYHNGTHSYIENYTGNVYFFNEQQDGDIYLQSDGGSGDLAYYVHIDGSEGSVKLAHYGNEKLATASSGINVTGNVGVQTTYPTSSTLVGAASSLIGMYIGDGHMLFSDNLSRSGGYYIPNGLNALNAGPVTLNSTMTLDGVWVIV